MVLGVSAPLAGQSRDASPRDVVIRWSPQVQLLGDGSDARRRAGNILGQAGISVSWRECGSSEQPTRRTSDECREPLQANEVVLRIVPGGSAGPGARASLGESLVESDGRGGSFSTIYADRVTAMARLAEVDVTDVLSRAVAHEIGHLLLGSTAHPRRGLMRALWSAAEFQRNATLDWLFSADEARTMRETIARRGAVARDGPSGRTGSVAMLND
jgi:hypothetical protein